MNLNDLLAIEDPSIDMRSIALMRHTPKELGDYLLDPSILDFYTSVQSKSRLDRFKYAMAFIVSSEKKTIFHGIYEVLGKTQLAKLHFSHLGLNPMLSAIYENHVENDSCVFYLTKRSNILADYRGRIVIEWGNAKISWFQAYSIEKPKEVLEILPSGYFKPFTDFMDVSLARAELEFLFSNQTANTDWLSHLSKVAGIYLILDEATGVQYIGSASGVNGVWGRWSDYVANPSGGNVRLDALLSNDPHAYRRFRYSLLEVMPGNALIEEVRSKEQLYKKKLGTRAFGLNGN